MNSLKTRLAAYKAWKAEPSLNMQFRTQFKHPGYSAGHWNREKNEYYGYYGLKAFGARDVGEAHEIVSLGHTGWYSDNYQDTTLVGHVCQLPGRDGQCRYLAYYQEESGVVVMDAQIHEEKEDAARAADELARIAAEHAREHCAEFQAEQDIADAKEQIHELGRQIRSILRDMREHPSSLSPVIKAACLELVQSHLAARRAEFNIIKAREADYWTAVPN